MAPVMFREISSSTERIADSSLGTAVWESWVDTQDKTIKHIDVILQGEETPTGIAFWKLVVLRFPRASVDDGACGHNIEQFFTGSWPCRNQRVIEVQLSSVSVAASHSSSGCVAPAGPWPSSIPDGGHATLGHKCSPCALRPIC